MLIAIVLLIPLIAVFGYLWMKIMAMGGALSLILQGVLFSSLVLAATWIMVVTDGVANGDPIPWDFMINLTCIGWPLAAFLLAALGVSAANDPRPPLHIDPEFKKECDLE